MSQSINSALANDDVNVHTPRSTALKLLADELRTELKALPENDAIHACGKAALAILKTRPLEALQLAKDHVQNQPYREVRRCWLRLYEDASLWRAAELLGEVGEARSGLLESDELSGKDDDWMSRIVRILDLGLVVSGGTLRGELYEAIFANLEPFLAQNDVAGDLSDVFRIKEPRDLQIEHLVPSVSNPSLEAFQIHLNNHMTPLLLTDTIKDWPAMEKWQDPSYLLHLALGGRRCVPVEIGETYTHADWRQEILPLRTFLQTYLLPSSPLEIGYLGQHNLFHQIPALLHDIRTPDYCYTSPPEITPTSRLNLPPVPPVDEPQKNIWLGPKGTRTPLHTDPYHNIFCQVVGYKYVRLYPPEATESVYPRGIDDNGINESNTAEVEIRFDPERRGNVSFEEEERFPMFGVNVEYREVIVGPGECLYIPVGWWHYIEALSVSCSVSFWWN